MIQSSINQMLGSVESGIKAAVGTSEGTGKPQGSVLPMATRYLMQDPQVKAQEALQHKEMNVAAKSKQSQDFKTYLRAIKAKEGKPQLIKEVR